MRKFRGAAAMLLAAALAGSNCVTAHAYYVDSGPGHVESQEGGASSPKEEAGPGAGLGQVDHGQAPGSSDQSAGGQDGQTSGEGQQSQQQEQASTAPGVTVTYTDGKGNQKTNVSMVLNNVPGTIAYRTYVNTAGFLRYTSDGSPNGGTEDSTYIEAVQVQLTGEAQNLYDVYYSCTTDETGKMGYAKNGELAGTTGYHYAVTDIDVQLVPKGSQGPVLDAGRYITPDSNYIKISADGTTYFYDDGTGYNGWLDYDNSRFYFQNGVALTGWHYIDGLKFYFQPTGQLLQDVDALIGKQSKYQIRVNKTLNCLTVYAPDGGNGYIIPVKAMLTSVGDDTPIGTFYTPEKYRWRLMVNDTYTQYATRLTAGQGFLFHSITYATPNERDLLTVGYNGLGVSRSLGCIRLTCENAKWIYDNCKLGTECVVYEDANTPSPFYKPDLVPIPATQTWDPTDPNVK